MPTQATQTTDSGFSPAKNRENQALLSLTVKQISEAHETSDDKSNFVIDGVDVNSIALVGMVTGKLEKVADVSFHLDDGTGRIEVHRWNGTYVCVDDHRKVFQGKKQVSAYSCRVIHKGNKMVKVGNPASTTVPTEIDTPYRNGPVVCQSAASTQARLVLRLNCSKR
ncbi:replication protein A 32 kDa subunit B-like [Aristolochia californica]|uniref:replication protein A 32 kDa subunit B-like n=1 Tax=Aristolochia californica TaxID=171875 RepID=UPI0035DE470B